MHTMDQEIMMQKKESFSRTLGVQRDSHSISKIKPKIRIIHIFAPDVIKTDASNFRELVQQLTGKPAESTNKKSRRKNTPCTTTTVAAAAAAAAKTDKMEVVRSGGSDDHDQYCYEYDERMKGEEEIWSGANSGGGYLSGFVDQPEGFMEQLNYEFPLLPVGTAAHGCLW